MLRGLYFSMTELYFIHMARVINAIQAQVKNDAVLPTMLKIPELHVLLWLHAEDRQLHLAVSAVPWQYWKQHCTVLCMCYTATIHKIVKRRRGDTNSQFCLMTKITKQSTGGWEWQPRYSVLTVSSHQRFLWKFNLQGLPVSWKQHTPGITDHKKPHVVCWMMTLQMTLSNLWRLF